MNKLDYIAVEVEIVNEVADVITTSDKDVNLPVMPF